MSSKTLLILLFLLPTVLIAQYDGYYTFPIRPGLQNFLSGTMGEIRGTHFHAGLDIKTGGVTGYKIHAVADGYVSRIKISPYGYGRALYVTHPNQTISVYAHLKSFREDMEKFVLEQQYEKESFSVNLFPDKKFKVSKGEIIGVSGNTGSSRAPHLHFEIRDINNKPLNPLNMGFTEVIDNIPPIITRIAFQCMDIQSRINGVYGRKELRVYQPKTGQYLIKDQISLEGRIGVEIIAHDKLDGSPWNRNGFPEIQVRHNDQLIFHQDIKIMSFAQKSNIKAYMNFENYKKRNVKFQKLYIDDGNWLTIYETAVNRGVINIADTSAQTIEIKLIDTYQNTSTLQFSSHTSNRHSMDYVEKGTIPRVEVHDNYLKVIKSHENSTEVITLVHNNVNYYLSPTYETSNSTVYLWDLQDLIPEKVNLGDTSIYTNIIGRITPSSTIDISHKDFKIEGKRNSVFDTLYIQYDKSYDGNSSGDIFSFRNILDPIRLHLNLTLKPQYTHTNLSKTHVYGIIGNKLHYQGGEWNEKNEITFKTKDLMSYTLAIDTIPPILEPQVINYYQAKIQIEDTLSGIKTYRASINGDFLLMEWDIGKKIIKSRKLDPTIPLKGEFYLQVSDNAGNESTFTKHID